MSDETTLLPCPFCGSKNVETSYKDTFSGDFRRGVYCADCCGGIYPYYDTEAEAITAWNTRADYHGYEQAAIEAWKSIKTWNTRATHGTLTAEQVREAIEANSWAETSSVREFNDSSWQAIADELNARAERTCKLEQLSAFDVTLNMLDNIDWGVCSECGCAVPMDAKFCNECGKVVSA